MFLREDFFKENIILNSTIHDKSSTFMPIGLTTCRAKHRASACEQRARPLQLDEMPRFLSLALCEVRKRIVRHAHSFLTGFLARRVIFARTIGRFSNNVYRTPCNKACAISAWRVSSPRILLTVIPLDDTHQSCCWRSSGEEDCAWIASNSLRISDRWYWLCRLLHLTYPESLVAIRGTVQASCYWDIWDRHDDFMGNFA